MKTPLCCLPLPFSNLIYHAPTITCRLQPAPPMLFLLSCFFGWMVSRATFDVLFYLVNDIILWIYTSSLGTLVPERPWCVLCNKASSLLGFDTYGFLLVLWVEFTHINTHTNMHTKTQGPVDWHTHINIYLHHLLYAHSSYLYCMDWIIHWHQTFIFQNAFSFQQLFSCKIHISVD